MSIKKLAIVGLLSAAFMAPGQSVFAQATETTIVVMPEEYQLRVLEEHVQMLRHKLYMKQKMSDKEKAAWGKQYTDVATRLQSWNKFSDEFDLSD
jgi:hypothetical protein